MLGAVLEGFFSRRQKLQVDLLTLQKRLFWGGYDEIQKIDPYHRCTVYLPTFIMKINHSCIGKYTMPMDSVWVMKNWEQILAAFAAQRLLRCPISLSGDSAFGISPHFGETQIFMENKIGVMVPRVFLPVETEKNNKKVPNKFPTTEEIKQLNAFKTPQNFQVICHLPIAFFS